MHIQLTYKGHQINFEAFFPSRPEGALYVDERKIAEGFCAADANNAPRVRKTLH
jgi:hypothetical protein